MSDAAATVDPAFGPVTTVVTRRVRPDRRAAYEDWLRRLLHDAESLDGYLGAKVQRPTEGTDDPRYTSVFRFATLDHLRRFEASELRALYLHEVRDLVEADAIWTTHTGLEMWFEAPAGTVVPQPVRWRMALVLGSVVYLLVLLFGSVAGLVLGEVPYPLRLALVIAVEITLMTYLILPWLTRRLAGWIYPSTVTKV